MAARVPLRPSWATSSGTLSAGVQMTARSGAAGSSSTLENTGWPSSSKGRWFTAHSGPAKPASRRLRQTSAPTALARRETPMTATERG